MAFFLLWVFLCLILSQVKICLQTILTKKTASHLKVHTVTAIRAVDLRVACPGLGAAGFSSHFCLCAWITLGCHRGPMLFSASLSTAAHISLSSTWPSSFDFLSEVAQLYFSKFEGFKWITQLDDILKQACLANKHHSLQLKFHIFSILLRMWVMLLISGDFLIDFLNNLNVISYHCITTLYPFPFSEFCQNFHLGMK